MNISEIIEDCIKNNLSLKAASLRDGYNPSYYSNLINRNFKHLKPKIKDIDLGVFEHNANYIYPSISNLIKKGLSTTDISKDLDISSPTILKIVKFKADYKLLELLTKNNNLSRVKGLTKSLGHAKGKTYEDLYSDRADQMRQCRSNWLKKNNIRRFATRISKPQETLYRIVKRDFPDAEIEFKIKIKEDKFIYLDIAIPSKKINIEYDGIYWHTLNETTIRTSDQDRDNFLRNQGWSIYRLQYGKNPSESQLRTDYLTLQLLND